MLRIGIVFLTIFLWVFAGDDQLEKEIKEAVRYLDSKIIEAPAPESREDVVYLQALKDLRAFLTGKHRDGERALKALLFIKVYSEKRGYRPFSEEKIKQLKLLIETIIRNNTLATVSALHHRS
ncbi:hypothetical protein [Persephonella sp.]